MAFDAYHQKLINEHFLPDTLLYNELMSKHTTFKIGGPADLLFLPRKLDELVDMIKLCKAEKIPYEIIGKGSNLLVRDKGVRGVVIKLSEFNLHTRVEGTKIIAGSGVNITNLSLFAQENGLSGLEFAYGIPGTLGGAVVMNAGAYGGEMQDIVKVVWALDEETNLIRIEDKDLEFSYRKSIFQRKNWVVVDVEMHMKPDSKEEIKRRMEDYLFRRQDKQPLSYPSAGSTFKRPDGYYAGALIEQAGLKGKRIGQAQVSPKHAGFIINLGNATAEDVLELMALVQEKVSEKFGVELVPEVKVIGEK
ncbi:MAG TPA: UDP-N-acetylmuramate dehydrogenase [Clostridia bacterium]|nr:UDP-N-acetylmuramate dehydrogenase [Clostridia bacterium]